MINITYQHFGFIEQQPVTLYTLTNQHGMSVQLINYGCTITSLLFPNKHGDLDDLVLGFDNLTDYLSPHPLFGCIVGRVANRIAEGKLNIAGKQYQLNKNESKTQQHLHGGEKGFNRYIWQSQIHHNGILLTHTSPDGDENYPGELKLSCFIALNEANELSFCYRATTNAPTVINLTNHSYFNLAGHHTTTHNHELQILSHFITPLNTSTLLPTGEISHVTNSAYDFIQPQKLDKKMQQRPSGDFDINYILDHYDGSLQPAAILSERESGRVMQLFTNQRAMQFYNAPQLGLNQLIGKQQILYQNFSGICLEAQNFPDSMHHSYFPSACLLPDETYHHHTVYRFGLCAN